MRRLMIVALALVASLTLVAPAAAQYAGAYWYTPKDEPLPGRFLGFKSAQAFVNWMGCDAPVVLWDIPDINAMYSPSRHKIVILQGLRDILTDDELAAVLAHEAGHCIHQASRPWITSIRDNEYDAEAHAHMILTVLGRKDVDALMLGIRMKFARLHNDYSGDMESATHGSANSISKWARLHDGVKGLDAVQAP